MSKLAVDGGTPVFGGKKAEEFVPSWPIPFPETEQKLIEVFRSGKWGGCGPYEQVLMTKFAAWQGSKYATWMVNGTVTLECALLALGIGPGDEVIVPGVSWIATAEAVIYVGAKPVIVDIDPFSWMSAQIVSTWMCTNWRLPLPRRPKPSSPYICSRQFPTWTKSWRSRKSIIFLWWKIAPMHMAPSSTGKEWGRSGMSAASPSSSPSS